MKTFMIFALWFVSSSSQAAKLSNNLYGEWRENCIKALDLSAKEESAPFVMYKMVLGWDGMMEHNYSYYSDEKCTKRKSQKREFAKYKVLESASRRAKILVSKDMGNGLIHQSVVEVRLPSINRMASKVLSTKIELDDLLSENPLEGVDKDSGSGESVKNLSRHIEEPKPAAKI